VTPFHVADLVSPDAAGCHDFNGRVFGLPMSARASGKKIEILRFIVSASDSPTICHACFSLVSSSIAVTVAPNLMVSPESFDTSITSARASLS